VWPAGADEARPVATALGPAGGRHRSESRPADAGDRAVGPWPRYPSVCCRRQRPISAAVTAAKGQGTEASPGQPARTRRGRWPPRSGRQAVGTGPSRGRPTRVTGQSARGPGTPRSAAGGSTRSVRQSRRPRDKAQKQARAEGRTGVGKVGHDKIRAGRLGTGRTCTSRTGQVAGRSGPQPPGQTARSLAGPATEKVDEPCKGGRAADSLVQRPNSHHDSSEHPKSHFRAPIFQNRCTIKEDEDELLITIRFAPFPNGARFSADFVFEMHTTFHAYPAVVRLRVARN